MLMLHVIRLPFPLALPFPFLPFDFPSPLNSLPLYSLPLPLNLPFFPFPLPFPFSMPCMPCVRRKSFSSMLSFGGSGSAPDKRLFSSSSIFFCRLPLLGKLAFRISLHAVSSSGESVTFEPSAAFTCFSLCTIMTCSGPEKLQPSSGHGICSSSTWLLYFSWFQKSLLQTWQNHWLGKKAALLRDMFFEDPLPLHPCGT